MSKINPLVQWWLSQKLPARHMVVDRDKLQDSHFKNIIIYVKHYFIHPVKRRIAKYYLVILKKVFNLKVIGITGSAGKTTTKDMLHSILKRNGRVVSSYKNIDPVYNIPSTILRCTPFTTYLVLEMGVEFPGEMDFYLWLVKPNVGVITNISVAHTEFFGDIGGVFREKSKLVKSLTGNDVSVLFREDKQLEKLEYKLRSKVEWFGDGSDVMSSIEKYYDVYSKFNLIFDQDVKRKIAIKLSVLGVQFVRNALAAAAVAKSFGFDLKIIKEGLETFETPEHRMKIIKLRSGAIILDDSYNNNPRAAILAIKTLGNIPRKKKVVVFGDMLELGMLEDKYHLDIAKYISRHHWNYKMICVGKASGLISEYLNRKRAGSATSYANWEKALEKAVTYSKDKNVAMLIKGSRYIELDKLVARLR